MTDLIATIALKWMEKRPFSEEGRARRKARRAQRKAERRARRKSVELSSEGIEYEVTEMSLKEKTGNLRTSTKAGIAGLVPLVLMALPFANEAEALIQQACQSENGAVPFLVGGAVVWVVSYITARMSKTPPNPGVI